jgi:3-oxoacyl-[acyl-carrier protein] reductase
MSNLMGKVAIVTGASKGIGAGIAKGLAAAGAAVAVNYAADREGAERVVAEITAKGGKAVAIQANVADAVEVARLFDAAKAAFGRLDVLVNNAGVYSFEPFEAVTEAEFHRQFDINVLGPVLTMQAALKHFGPDGGSVINIGSVVSQNARPDSVIYSATKSALDTMTVALSRGLGDRNIRVNVIAPGGTASEGLATAGILDGEFVQEMIGVTPLGRLGQPEDIAKVAVFLASDDAAWLTGERISASGGWR